MGSTITRRSSDPPVPIGAAQLLDAEGSAAPEAPGLLAWRPEAPVISHGRAPGATLDSAMSPRGLADLGAAAVLRVTGSERESWIQGVQTADVLGVPALGARQTLFLNARGRALCDALLWRLPEELLVVVPTDRIEPLRAHLDGLLIMEDAELSIATDLHRLRLCPSGAEELIAALLPAQREELASIHGAPTPLGLELLLPEAQAQSLLAAIPLRPDLEALERERIALGVPKFAQDFDDSSTPLEAGLDAQIAFGKGCYVGQEVIAMATYRGRVPWNLVRLEVAGAPPAIGSALDTVRGGKGKVTSSASLGNSSALLGIVHREKIEPGSELLLADGRTATVLGLPYGSRPGAGQK
jgi:folate-binding protein YgfZ